MTVVHKLNVNLGRQEAPPRLSFMQQDSARQIEVKLYENNVPWNVPDGASVYLAFRKSNGENIKCVTLADGSPVATCSDNVVTISVPPEMTALPGSMPVVIVFVDGSGSQIATFPIAVTVQQNPASDSEEAEPITPDQFDQLLSSLALERARINELVAMRGTTHVAEYVHECNINANGKTAFGECTFRSNGCSVDVEARFTTLYIPTESPVLIVDEIPSDFIPLQAFPITFVNLYSEKIRLYIDNNCGKPALFICNDGVSDFAFGVDMGEYTGNVFIRTASYALKDTVIPELDDIRVGYDGTTYETAGEAVREQVKAAMENGGGGGASIDDTAVSDKAWSSKNIVDRMCPTFTESGASVTCQPVEAYPLQVVSRIEAVQEGWGDPDPGEGINLFTPDMVTSCGSDTMDLVIPNLEAGDYTFSIQVDSNSKPTMIYCKTGSNNYDEGDEVYGSSNKTFTITGDPVTVYMRIEWWDDSVDMSYILAKTKLEVGTEVTPISTIRPITGHSAVKLIHIGGKNLFDIRRVESSDTCINNGDGSLMVKNGAGPFRLEDLVPRYEEVFVWDDEIDEPLPLTISFKSSVNGAYMRFDPDDLDYVFNSGDNLNNGDDMIPIINFFFCWEGEEETATISDIQIEVGTEVTEYEPNGDQEVTVELGQTVYGGSYDWQRGVLTINKVAARLTSDIGWTMSGANNPNGIMTFYTTNVYDAYAHNTNNYHPVVSSHYPCYVQGWAISSVSFPYAIKLLNNRVYIADARFTDLDSFKAFLDAENVQLLYDLVEPITVQLDPQEFLALSGVNTLHSDTGDTTVAGRADLAAFVAKLQETIAQQAEQISALQAAAVNNV